MFVYDTADRLVMHQTPSIELPGGAGGRGWLFTKYDALGRVILSGVYHGDDNSTIDVNSRAFNMTILFQNILSKESTSSSAADFYYTWNTFPSKNQSEVTLVNFYDNYTYATDGISNLNYQTKSDFGAQHTSAKGLLTGTWVKMLDGSGWIKTTCYYDAFGNLVQKRSTNQKGGYDYEYYAYNYNNLVTRKYTEHTVAGQAMIPEEYNYSYDTKLRLTKVNYKFNGGTGVDIASYQYNDLGQVKEKKTGGGMETTAFKYNIRGWQTEQAGQRFSENLYYESGHPNSGTAVYWGGNVSVLTWKDASQPTTLRGYDFKYNPLGWLGCAEYGEGANLGSGMHRYDEVFSYDQIGNIKKLMRYGMRDNNSFGVIDDLTIEYLDGRIRKITDKQGNQSASDVMEFKYNSEPVNDGHYFYNLSGALMADYHKRICMIKYNYLTLPKSVQFRKGDRIEYVYDAAGVKRQTKHKTANKNMNYGYWDFGEPAASDFNESMTVTRDYVGNKVYVNNQLKYVLTEEGYIEKATGSNTYAAHYYLNDRLGNHRIVMDASGNVKQVNNYYPSGTSMAERRTDQGVQPYKFGGKELDRTGGLDFYDFEARSFDPVLMRFMSPDPLAEKYYSISPYAYCMNNPVRFVDPTGMWVQYIDSTGHYRYNNGQWEQYQTSGANAGQYTAYTPVSGSFLEGVLNGLNELNINLTGNELLNFFANDNNNAFIKQGTSNTADISNSASGTITLDTNFKGNPIPTESGVQMSPFWLDIGHELAHRQDVIKNGATQAQALWLTQTSDGVDVSTSEKYATHIENQMRADAGLPLRTHYVKQGFGGYAKSAILNNGVSIFYGTNYKTNSISKKLNRMLKLRTP